MGVIIRPRLLTALSITVLLLAGVSVSEAASSWDASYRLISQAKRVRGTGDNYSFPINQYGGFDFAGLPKNISFQTNFSGYVNPVQLSTPYADEFDLYQAVLHVEPLENVVAVDVGRQRLTDGFYADIFDGVTLGATPEDLPVGFSFYGGVPRYLEVSDFDGTESLVAGFRTALQNFENTQGEFSAQYRKINATVNNFGPNDTILLGLALHQQFPKLAAAPSFYGDFQYDVAGEDVEVGTLGVDLFPHWRLALNFEGNYFDVDRTNNQQTVFGNYFSNEIMQGKEGAELMLPKDFRLFEEFSYYRYAVQNLGGKNGYSVGAGIGRFWESIKLSTRLSYYFTRDYGGTVQGGYVEIRNSYIKYLNFYLNFDFSNYSKITNQDGRAYSVLGGVDYNIADYCRLTLGGEYNRNNWYRDDGRVTLDFSLDIGSGLKFGPDKHLKRTNRRFNEL